MRTRSEFVIPMEKVLKLPSHTFRHGETRWGDVKTRESQVETLVLCKFLIQKGKRIFLSIEIFAMSFKCELTALFEEKELLNKVV